MSWRMILDPQDNHWLLRQMICHPRTIEINHWLLRQMICHEAWDFEVEKETIPVARTDSCLASRLLRQMVVQGLHPLMDGWSKQDGEGMDIRMKFLDPKIL
jgi:hypothetical protein